MVITQALRDLFAHSCLLRDNTAQNIASSPAKRARKPKFTPAEWTVVFEEVEKNIKIIKNKIPTTLSNKLKSRVWEVITDKVNALGVSKRSAMEVKEKWRGMVSGMEQRKNTANVPLQERWPGVKRNQILQRLPQPKLSSFSKQNRLSAAFQGL